MGINLKLIGYINGILLLILSIVLAITGMTGLMPSGSGGSSFLISALTTTFLGGLLFLSNRGADWGSINIRTGYFLTVSCWILISIFSALPLYFSSLGLSFTDSVFETVSALTTTGATVLTGLDNMSHDILLWRSLLQWMGGIGIVVMAITIFPFLRVGGMSLFKMESSDIAAKLTPRLAHLVKMMTFVYVLLTLLCAILMYMAGMSPFDAINHAMTTLSTGGFSTHDASLGYFNSVPLELITIVFMVSGALPLVMYADFLFVSHQKFSIKRYGQVGSFLIIWCIAIAAVSFWNWQANNMTPLYALRLSAFNVTSIITDTGFATADFAQWGSFAVGVFFLLYFIGGCAGSTSGSIKIFRWQILFRGLHAQFLKNLSPHRVANIYYAGNVVQENVLHGVRNFLFLYILTFAFFSLGLMACGVDFISSTSGIAQAMANAGPGLGEIIGPAGNFSTLPVAAKWILDAAMILGRLELFTVYALFIPDFWKR